MVSGCSPHNTSAASGRRDSRATHVVAEAAVAALGVGAARDDRLRGPEERAQVGRLRPERNGGAAAQGARGPEGVAAAALALHTGIMSEPSTHLGTHLGTHTQRTGWCVDL